MSLIFTIDDLISQFDDTEQGTEEWKRLTENSIGGSSCSIVIGENQYMSSSELLNQMLKKTKRAEGNLRPCFHGQICEAIHVALFTEMLKCKIGIVGFYKFSEQKHFSADAVAILSDGSIVLFEFKTPYSRRPAKTPGSIKPEYKCQIQYSMGGFPFDYTLFSEVMVLYDRGDFNNSIRATEFKNMGRFELHVRCDEIPGTYHFDDLNTAQIDILCRNFIKTDYIKLELNHHACSDLRAVRSRLGLTGDSISQTIVLGEPGHGNIIVTGYFGPWYVHKVYPNKNKIAEINRGVDTFLKCLNNYSNVSREKDNADP